MSKDDKKKTTTRSDEHHDGSVAPQDAALTTWLDRLWARGEPPERLELWQMFGVNKATRGEMIFHVDFKTNEKLDVEQANKLANEIVEAAQNDCDSVPKRRESYYQIAILDRNRRAMPLVRRVGPLVPQRAYALAKVDEEDEEENALDAKSLALKYVQEGLSQARWEKNRNDHVLGDVIVLLGGLLQDFRTENNTLRAQNISTFERMQDAQDRALDREMIREGEKFKRSLLKDGVRTVRNLLPGLFAGTETGESEKKTSNGHANGEVKDHGPSDERTLVDNFLTDIEEDEKLAIALFGDFEERDGKAAQVNPGIFTLKQYMTLVGVREGRLPPDALDPLMPKSGDEMAVTQEQIEKAADAGLSEGIGMALLQIVGLRKQKKEAATNNEKER